MKRDLSRFLAAVRSTGETPLVRLSAATTGCSAAVYAKLESHNPTGSIKDRVAAEILSDALAQADFDRFTSIVESSSGNLGIALAYYGACLGMGTSIVVDPNATAEALQMMRLHGARPVLVTTPDEGGGYLKSRIAKVRKLVESQSGWYWPDQYRNPANPRAHYRWTMPEIIRQLGFVPDTLLCATSTTGTLMGCATYLKDQGCKTRIVAVDATGSALFGQPPGRRLIPGHGASVQAPLLDRSLVDDVVHVNDEDCIRGCRLLLANDALSLGGSSGGLLWAARKLHCRSKLRGSVVLLFPDHGNRYQSTIFSHEWVRHNFPSLQEIG